MENYADAALRHWNDAKLLEDGNRVENADHHYGFAAECAIKYVLNKLPSFSNNGTLEPGYKQHIPVLWGKVNPLSLQKTYPSLCAPLKSKEPFF